jgi:hypothetical protein
MVKGPIDLLAIQTSNQSIEFNAYITYNHPSGLGATTVGPITSTNGLINQCFKQIILIKLELFDLPISTSKQTLQLNLTTCEHTLRKF